MTQDPVLGRRVWSDRQLRQRLSEDEARAADQSGSGGSAGLPVVRKFPFAYNTPNLLTGHAVYTPTVDDILLDAWVEIDTAWDGTLPAGDIGTFVDDNFGVLGDGYLPWDMTLADTTLAGGGFLNAGVTQGSGPTVGQSNPALSLVGVFRGSRVLARILPAKFISADPVKIVVSQDGSNTGADPGSAQGAAVLYLVTATPA